MRIRRVLAVAACAALVPAARAGTIDFTSDAGMKATCARLATVDAAKLRRDDERTAHAICAAVALGTDAARWMRSGGLQLGDVPAARARLESWLVRIASIRATLERVKSRGPLFTVAPGEWAIDFDGDGEVSTAERHFFWVPKRGSGLSPFARAAGEDAYRADYTAPVVKVDRADIYWALAYCNFAEAALNLVLAYDVRPQRLQELVLVDRERVRREAYARLREGIRYSARLREALLAETDDDREWIGNPRQRDTSFPLVMDAQTFETWGAALREVADLLEGRALYGGRIENGSGVTDLTFGMCAPGQGIDVRDLFLNPLVHPADRAELASRCMEPAKGKPITRLASLAAASIQRNSAPGQGASGEWQLLRHLYWVN